MGVVASVLLDHVEPCTGSVARTRPALASIKLGALCYTSGVASLRFRRWLFVVALAVCGVALLGVAVRTEQGDCRLAHKGVRATATITQTDPGFRRPTYLLTWTADSRPYSVWTSNVLGRPANGDTVDVVFDPAEPDAVRDARGLRPYWWLGGMAPLLVAALVMAAAWILRPQRKPTQAATPMS
jgi:hypothetical protein